MTAKGVKDCVVAYQGTIIYALLSLGLGTCADMTNLIFGNIPGLKRFTPISTYLCLLVGNHLFIQQNG